MAEDAELYHVVISEEEQYTIWPADREVPAGWKITGGQASRQACLDFIETEWTDMRPRSVRQAAEAPEPSAEAPSDGFIPPGPALVERLCSRLHPVVPGGRPVGSREVFEHSLERGYTRLRFLDTEGGTEVGMQLDMFASRWSAEDLHARRGSIHLEGVLILDGEEVRCVADIDLERLEGTGGLRRVV